MFDKTDRTLMAMLFKRGTIKEMDTTVDIWGFERHVAIHHYRADLWRDDDYYMATISGWEDEFTGETLDEVLDQLDAYIEECKAAHERVTRRTAYVLGW